MSADQIADNILGHVSEVIGNVAEATAKLSQEVDAFVDRVKDGNTNLDKLHEAMYAVHAAARPFSHPLAALREPSPSLSEEDGTPGLGRKREDGEHRQQGVV